jgi:hypothetical protein
MAANCWPAWGGRLDDEEDVVDGQPGAERRGGDGVADLELAGDGLAGLPGRGGVGHGEAADDDEHGLEGLGVFAARADVGDLDRERGGRGRGDADDLVGGGHELELAVKQRDGACEIDARADLRQGAGGEEDHEAGVGGALPAGAGGVDGDEEGVVAGGRHDDAGERDGLADGGDAGLHVVDGARAGLAGRAEVVGAAIAEVADLVFVLIGLGGVGDAGAVVQGVGDAVAVEILGVHRRAGGRVGVEGARVAGVAVVVAVHVGLGEPVQRARRVEDGRAVVDCVGEAVTVHVIGGGNAVELAGAQRRAGRLVGGRPTEEERVGVGAHLALEGRVGLADLARGAQALGAGADVQRLAVAGRGEAGDGGGVAVEHQAAAQHQDDVVDLGVEDGVVAGVGGGVEDRDVGGLSDGQAAEDVAEAEELGCRRGGHGDEVSVGEVAVPVDLVPVAGAGELAEHVDGAGGGPVGAEGD